MAQTISPPFMMTSCRVLAALIAEYQERNGISDLALSQMTGKSRETIASIKRYDGMGVAPSMNSMLPIDAHIRREFDPDSESNSEKLYHEVIAKALHKAGYANGKFTPPA